MVVKSIFFCLLLISAISQAYAFSDDLKDFALDDVYLPDLEGYLMDHDEVMRSGMAILSDDYLDELRDKTTNLKLPETVKQNDDSITYKILLSDSMGEKRIKKLIKDLRHRNDVSFYIKGMNEEKHKNLNDIFGYFSRLDDGTGGQAPIYLDPRPFRQIGATIAPAIMAYSGDELLAYALGNTNPNWLELAIESGKSGNLGVVGETYAVVERELAEIAKERWNKLDKQKMLSRARDNYWHKATFLDLPYAIKDNVRRFEPFFTLNKDILDHKGQILFNQGEQFNPLEHLPFTQKMVVFDATNDSHLKFVKSIKKKSRKKITLITTKLDRKLKFKSITEVEKELDHALYLLNEDVLRAFDLSVVPSIVEADNESGEFIISEYEVN